MENSTHLAIRQFRTEQAANEDWEAAFRFRRQLHEATEPDEPYLPDEAWKRNFLLQLQDETLGLVLYIVYDDSDIVGIANLGWMTPQAAGYEENKYSGFASIEILPQYRRRGIARQLLSYLLPVAKEHQLRTLIGGTIEEDGRQWIIKIGGKEALANIDNRLVLDEVNWQMVEQWIAGGSESNPRTRLEEFDIVPEERLEAFVRAFDATLRQVPTGELEMTLTVDAAEVRRGEERRQKLGRTHLKLVSVETDGSISGLTWLTHEPNLPAILYQGLTGVMEAERGRGLGKWLKAETLQRARDRYPEVKYIKTDNATSNAPMISINERLGFREFRRNYNLQVSVAAIEQYLAS